MDLVPVLVYEALQAGFEEPDLRPAVDDEPTGDQPLRPPTGDGPGRDVVTTADRLNGQDRLGGLAGSHPGRRRQILDEQSQVVPDVRPVEDEGVPPLGAEPGDPEVQILVRVTFLGGNLRQQRLGPVDLIDPDLDGDVPDILPQPLQGRVAVSV